MCSDEPYLRLKMAHVGAIQLGVTVLLVSISLAHINDPVTYPDVNTYKGTLWAMKHYKTTATGIKYFNYSDPDTGKKLNGELTDQWFEERLKGKYVYFYGLGFDNYCWPRKAPDDEWLPSLFRSGQLLPWVQVPLRAAILLGMTFRIFQAIVLAFMRVQLGPECKLNGCLARIFVANEILHNVSLFYVLNYLVTPDKKYLYMMAPSIIAAYITFSFKMWMSFWHTGLRLTTGIRLLLFLVASQTIIPNYKSCLEYLQYNYCDSKVPSLQAFNELAIVCCLLISELLDIYQTRTIESVINGTEDAVEDEDRIKREAGALS